VLKTRSSIDGRTLRDATQLFEMLEGMTPGQVRVFELYRDGIELANGYHECSDAAELRVRHEAELPLHPGCILDAAFHACLAAGVPDCAGVAVGFDRAVMIALGLPSVAATMV
jgi:lysyl-tRNA synthetase class 2